MLSHLPRTSRATVALLGALAALSPAEGSAQETTSTRVVIGQVVTDSATPLPGAALSLLDASGRGLRGTSAPDGRFRLSVVDPGRYTLRVAALGYRTRVLPVDVREAESSLGVVRLERAATLATVSVIGGGGADAAAHPSAADLLTSVSVLSAEQIARENVSFSQELLRKVPGMYQANFNQGIVSGDIGVRGFNTESEIASTKLLVDGIPMNLNSGYAELNPIFPLEIERMEVVRGTNDPRFGIFNLAGNVNVVTREGGRYLTTRALAGSFGTTEAQLATALTTGRFSQTYFLGARRADGWRANSAMDRQAFAGKWFLGRPGDRLRVGLTARTYALDTDAPGYLTRDESNRTPAFSPAFSASDGGQVFTRQVALHAEARPAESVVASVRGYRQRFDRRRFVRFTAAGAQQERIEDEAQTGFIAEVTWRPETARRAGLILSAGLDGQWQDNLQQRYRTAARARQATLRDFDFSLDNTGGFVRADATLADRVRLDIGLRVDRFGGAFTDRLANRDLPILSFGTIPQPKASATIKVLEQLDVYGNVGRSFQTGVGIAAYGRTPLSWSRNDGWETGFTARPSAATTLRAGVWRQDASDEVRLRFDNSGDSENIGRTRRSGVDIEATAQLHRTLSIWASGTSQRAVLVEPGARAQAVRGNDLNHVPRWTSKYGADWTPHPRWQASFWAFGQGDYELTPANDRGRFGGYTAVNADLSVKLRGVALGLGVQNLTDSRIEYVWWDGAQTLHSPGAPRSLVAFLTVDR